jgi:hypothetical protein
MSERSSNSRAKSSTPATHHQQTHSPLLDNGPMKAASLGPRTRASHYKQARILCPDRVGIRFSLHAEPNVDESLHRQYQLLHSSTQRLMTATYPATILEYKSLAQCIKDYENKIAVLVLLNFRDKWGEIIASTSENGLGECDSDILRQERDALQAQLTTLRDELRLARKQCILQGRSPDDINQRFGLQNYGDSLAGFINVDSVC